MKGFRVILISIILLTALITACGRDYSATPDYMSPYPTFTPEPNQTEIVLTAVAAITQTIGAMMSPTPTP